MTFRYRCPEHGVVAAKWRPDPKMRAFGHFECSICARLNFKAWMVVNKQKNRARAAAWYANPKNRQKVLDRQKAQRASISSDGRGKPPRTIPPSSGRERATGIGRDGGRRA